MSGAGHFQPVLSLGVSMKVKEQNVPVLRFPGFESNWEQKQLKDLTKINQGLQIAISERYTYPIDGGYFYITNEFLRENSRTVYYIKNPSKSVVCSKNDILMTRTGNTGQVVTGVEGAFHNNFFKISYKEECERLFLYYFLTSHKTQHTILKLAGTSTIPDLNHGDFYKIAISIPFLPEQQKIASFLTAVDSKIKQLSKKKALLEQYKKGMMQKLFSQELRFKDEQGNDFPDWEEKRLGELFKVGSGRDYKHLSAGDIPVYGSGGYMTSVDEFLYNGESVCIGRKGTIDKPMFLNGKFWTVDTLFFTHSFTSSIPKFIYAIVQTINWKKYNEASGVPSLSKKTIEQIKISIPFMKEQEKIADFLSSIDKKINLITTELNHAQSFKKALLQQMFA